MFLFCWLPHLDNRPNEFRMLDLLPACAAPGLLLRTVHLKSVKTLTVCSNKFTYLLESTSSQQLVVTFIMGLP
jgi:hypothetical protein